MVVLFLGSQLSLKINLKCRVYPRDSDGRIIPSVKPTVLNGFEDYGSSSSSTARRRFDPFVIKGSGDTSCVYQFLCCATLVAGKSAAAKAASEGVEIKDPVLLQMPFIIAKRFKFGDNPLYDSIRGCFIHREYFKYTQYTDAEELVAISIRSVDKLINLYVDPDDPRGTAYVFNIV
jgi:hypothetical protein